MGKYLDQMRQRMKDEKEKRSPMLRTESRDPFGSRLNIPAYRSTEDLYKDQAREAQSKYQQYKESQKAKAMLEDQEMEEIKNLRKKVQKPPTNERARGQYAMDMDRLRRLQMSQNPTKMQIYESPYYMPPAVDKLDTKLENISKALKSGDENFFYNIKEGSMQGMVQNWFLNEYYRKLHGLPNQADKLQKFMQDNPELQASYEPDNNFWRNATRFPAEQAPMWLSAGTHSLGKGTLYAASFSGMALAAGQTPPLVLAPEEPFTTTAAALLGFRFGTTVGVTEYMAAQEAGQAYMEMINSGTNPEIAYPIAMTVGAFNGLIESAQIGNIIKANPAVKKFTDNFKKMALKEGAKKVAAIVASYGGELLENTAEEMLQQSTTIAGVELSKLIHQNKTGEELQRRSFKDIAAEVIETGKQALMGFALTPSIGIIRPLGEMALEKTFDVMAEANKQKAEARKQQALYQDLPGAIKEYQANMDTVKEKDAIGLIDLDLRLDYLAKQSHISEEDKKQINVLKSEIKVVMDKVAETAKAKAPNVEFTMPKEKTAAIKEIISGEIKSTVQPMEISDYKSAEKAGVVETIISMLEEKKSVAEIGETIKEKLPKKIKQPEVISAIIGSVQKVDAAANYEVFMSKIKNIHEMMQFMPQNSTVINTEDEIASTNAQNGLEQNESVNTLPSDQNSAKREAVSAQIDSTSYTMSEKEKAEYKKKLHESEHVKELRKKNVPAKIENEVMDNTNPVVKRYKRIIKKLSNNPIFNGLGFMLLDEQKTITFNSKEEAAKHGYDNVEIGKAYPIGGGHVTLDDSNRRRITLYSAGSADTILEEVIHDIQKRLDRIDPELQQLVTDWEAEVVKKASSEGFEIYSGYELFAKAMVFSEMGWAKEDPYIAEIIAVPDEISIRFQQILGDDLIGLMTGRDKVTTPKATRKLNVDQQLADKKEKRSGHANPEVVNMQIKDKAFEKWFAGSKIVDKNGQPLVVYHGTEAEFSKFDNKKIGSSSGNSGFLGKGFYFTKDLQKAKAYGKPIAVYLKMGNPFVINGTLSEETIDILNRVSDTYAFEEGATHKDAFNGFSFSVPEYPEIAEAISFGLQAEGYDGIVYGDFEEIVVFDHKQIKSAETGETMQIKEKKNEKVKDQEHGKGDNYIFDSRRIVDRAIELAARGGREDFSKIRPVEYRLYARYGAFRVEDYNRYVIGNDEISPSFKNGIMEAMENAKKEGRHKADRDVTWEEWFYREFGYDFSMKNFKKNHEYPIDLLTRAEELGHQLDYDEAAEILLKREKARYQYFKDRANGKASDESFQLKADTKEFKDWFEGSKVVDENGQPLLVYHGTDKVFKQFEGFNGVSYFTELPAEANGYAMTYEAENIKSAIKLEAKYLRDQMPAPKNTPTSLDVWKQTAAIPEDWDGPEGSFYVYYGAGGYGSLFMRGDKYRDILIYDKIVDYDGNVLDGSPQELITRQEYIDMYKERGGGAAANIIPAYLNIKNPYRSTNIFFGNQFAKRWTPETQEKALKELQKLKDEGYDGIIVPSDAVALANEIGDGPGHDVLNYLVFDHSQIRSAISGMTLQLKAYHGTPHKVDKFSTKYIGTGEGEQVYGWGLYFTNKKEIADWYRNELSTDQHSRYFIDGEEQDFKDNMGLYNAIVLVETQGYDNAVKQSEFLVDYYKNDGNDTTNAAKYLAMAERDLKYVKSLKGKKIDKKKGNVYEVTLAPDEDDLLDWDKPLIEQSPKVLKKLQNTIYQNGVGVRRYAIEQYIEQSIMEEGSNRYTGKDLYRHIGTEMWQQYGIKDQEKAASQWLAANGIPGIKYKAGTSRYTGHGEDYNYVIFQDDQIAIDASYQLKNVGYHAGDLGKAEGFWSMETGNRGTGHFGTGTYFVANPEELQGQYSSYKDRPKHEVSFEGYNLHKPRNDREAEGLHAALKFINNYHQLIDREDVFRNASSISHRFERLLDELGGIHYDMDEAKKENDNAAYERADQKRVELEKAINDILYNERLLPLYKQEEIIRNADGIFDNYIFKIQDALKEFVRRQAKDIVYEFNEFGLNLLRSGLVVFDEEAKAMIREINAEIDEELGDNWWSDPLSKKADSASTRFMKKLGYEGVDVRHLKNFDNTKYGSVIYDLRKDQATLDLEEAGFIVDEDGTISPTDISYSVRTVDFDKLKAAAKKKNPNVDPEVIDDYFNPLRFVYGYVIVNKNALDYTENPRYSALKTNQDPTYDYSVDFSALCKNRYILQATQEAIQKEIKQYLNKGEILAIRQALLDAEQKVNCGECFVESKRVFRGKWVNKFIANPEGIVRFMLRRDNAKPNNKERAAIDAIAQGRPLQSLPTRKRREIAKIEAKYRARYKFTEAEEAAIANMPDVNLLLTVETQEEFHKQNPFIFGLFNRYVATATHSKSMENRTAYKQGQIVRMKKFVKRMNENAGIRFQSFSDFEAVHLFDLMQAIYDCWLAGAAAHAYAKDMDFARAACPSGMMVNGSLLPAGKGYEGNKLIHNEKEGMKYSVAMHLRKLFPDHFGTILIGANDEHIIIAMADDEIDYIIPYHASGASKETLQYMGMESHKDYSQWQAEIIVDNEKYAEYGIKHLIVGDWFDYVRGADENIADYKARNTQNYLDKCFEYGLRPKFDMFVDRIYNEAGEHTGYKAKYAGYWKMLIERKMYNDKGYGIKQQPLQPIFNEKVLKNIMDLSIKNNPDGVDISKYVHQPTVDKFLKGEIKVPKLQTMQLKPAETFYSKMQRVIEQKMPNKMLAKDLIPFLKAAGVKAEEIKWSGIEDMVEWANTEDGKIPKEDLLKYMELSQLEIETVEYGDDYGDWERNYNDTLNGMVYNLREKMMLFGRYSHLQARNMTDGLAKWEVDPSEFPSDLRAEAEAIKEYALNVYRGTQQGKGRWREFSLPAAKNYKEMLFKAPNLSGEFNHSHWEGNKNVFAHARTTDREDTDGNRVLFIEELQSDLHQKGHKLGYNTGEKIVFYTEFRESVMEKFKDNGISLDVTYGRGTREDHDTFDMRLWGTQEHVAPDQLSPDLKALWDELQERAANYNNFEEMRLRDQQKSSVPDAPFKADWHEFLLKNLIRHAAEQNYDKIAWTTGKQQADRNSLTQHISKIEFDEYDNGAAYVINAFDRRGERVFGRFIPTKELPEVVGNDIADKIVNRERVEANYQYRFNVHGKNGKIFEVLGPDGEVDQAFSMKRDADSYLKEVRRQSAAKGTIEGVDLETGGTFHKKLYDIKIPSFLKKYLKPLGSTVETIEMIQQGNVVYAYEGPELTIDELHEIRQNPEIDYDIRQRIKAVILSISNTPGNLPFSWHANTHLSEAAAEAIGGKIVKTYEPVTSMQQGISITDKMKQEVIYNGQPLFQLKKDPFYSRLEKVIEQKMQKSAPVTDVMNMIRSAGVKEEEIRWSGLEDYIYGNDKVNKVELLEYLKANDLGIREVVKADSVQYLTELQARELWDQDIAIIGVDYEGVGSMIEYENDFNNFEQFLRDADADKIDNTKFRTYTLPGGENYKEILFTLPWNFNRREYSRFRKQMLDKYGNGFFDKMTKEEHEKLTRLSGEMGISFNSSHWEDEENVFAHTRITDRVDQDGSKVLFIEEIQSDWHQKGRKYGYHNKERQRRIDENRQAYWATDEEYFRVNREIGELNTMIKDAGKYGGLPISNEEWSERYARVNLEERQIMEIRRQLNDEYDELTRQSGSSDVPEGPFKKTWHEFVIKRMIRYAAEHGYEKVAFANGSQNASRYGLERVLDHIYFNKKPHDFEEGKIWIVAYRKMDNTPVIRMNMTPKEIAETFGEEILQKILTGEETGTLDGDGLKIGGEGMKGFYDKMIPDFLRKYLKQWGVQLEEITIQPYSKKRDWAYIEPLDEPGAEGFAGQENDLDLYVTNVNGDEYFAAQQQNGTWTLEDHRDHVINNNFASLDDLKTWFEKYVEKFYDIPNILEQPPLRQQGFTVNEKMRHDALYVGQPLYQLRLGDGGIDATEFDGDLEERSWPQTVAAAPITDPELAARLEEYKRLYVIMHNEETKDKALRMLLDMGEEEAFRWILSEDQATPEMFAIAQMMTVKYQKDRNFDRAEDIIDATAKKATSLGQAIQILSMYGRMSPEGVIRHAKKMHKKLLKDSEINEVNKKTRKLREDMRDINIRYLPEVGVEDLIEEISKETPEEQLAKRIGNTLKDPVSKEYDPIQQMIKTLFEVAKEQGLPNNKPIKPTPLELIAEAIMNHEEYADIWVKAKDIVMEQFYDDPAKMEILNDYFGRMVGQPFPDSMLNNAAKTGLKEMNVKIREIVREYYTEIDKISGSLKTKLIAEAGLSGDEAALLEGYIAEAMDRLTHEAKESVLSQMFKPKNVSERARQNMARRIIELSNLGAMTNNTYKHLVAAKLGYPTLTEDVITSLDYQAQALQAMPDGDEKNLAIAKMLDTIAATIPVSYARKINTLQTMAQLLNGKTIGRNLLGNFGFMQVERVLRNFEIPIDMFVSVFTKQRTKAYIGFNGFESIITGDGFWEGWKLGLRDALAGVNTTNIQTRHELYNERTFRMKDWSLINTPNNIAAGAEILTNIALRATDRAFLNAAFVESLAEQLKIANVSEPTEAMVMRATADGLYRTFQDDNVVSGMFVAAKRMLNLGFRKKGPLAWGPGDLILKYPRTPGNLLARAIDYSPLGFAAVAFKLFYDMDAKRGQKAIRSPKTWQHQSEDTKYTMQKQAVEGFTRALAGTAIIWGGYLLARLGVISGSGGDDDYDIYYMKQTVGLGNYQVNKSALGRLIASGFKEEAAKREVGDEFVTYDWYQPHSTSIAIGADMALRIKSYDIVTEDDRDKIIQTFKSREDAKLFLQQNKGMGYVMVESIDAEDFASSLMAAVETGAGTLEQQPLLTGIRTFLGADTFTQTGKSKIAQGFTDIAQGAASSFVPTLFSQIAQIIDSERRSVYDLTWAGEALNLVKRKTPVISSELEPNLDVFGRSTHYYDPEGSAFSNIMYSLFSPAAVTRYEPTKEAQLVIDLYDEFKDKRTVPKKLDRKINVNGRDITLTPMEYTELQQYAGERLSEILGQQANTNLRNLSDLEQIDIIDNIYNIVYNEVKLKIEGMRNIPRQKKK